MQVAAFCQRHPEILADMAKFSATMAMGNIFIYRLQCYWGSLTVTITTTMRKLGSVIFSVLWFGPCGGSGVAAALRSPFPLFGHKRSRSCVVDQAHSCPWPMAQATPCQRCSGLAY